MEQAAELLRVLVVDDNEDAAMLVAELLRMRGHAVEVANGGPQGLEAACSTIPDVVVLDIGMPLMDGYQVALALRHSPSTCKVRLVALTAWGDADSRQRAIKSGFDLHLVKPAPFDDLFKAVEVARV
jgi:CheY-like chemotaxis protein